MRFREFSAGFGVALLVGCAHTRPSTPEPANQAVQDLERKLFESQARESEQQRKIDELNNRLFILQDQLEARDVHATQKAPPRLPVDKSADKEDENGEVEYAGAARDAHAPRPVLRLVGSQLPRAPEVVTPTAPAAAPPPSPVGKATKQPWRPPEDDFERLPVTRSVPPIPTRENGRVAAATPTAAVPAPIPLHVPVPAAVRPAPAAAPSGVDAMNLYTGSVDMLKHGQHAEAIAGFEKFIRSFPSHDYADNAQYWLGECYYDQKDWKTALREFRRVVQRYPSGNKVPDALLKVGYCYWQLQEAGKARDVLEQVLKSYPGTEVAKKAQAKLLELK